MYVNELDIYDLTGVEFFCNLTDLFCHDNQLTHLDVSMNTALERLDCNDNLIYDLDISANTELDHLDCSNNQLSYLDISGNWRLSYLKCSNNYLTELDLSENNVERLHCNDNKITELKLNNEGYLYELDCSNNNLSELDIRCFVDCLIYFDGSSQTVTVTSTDGTVDMSVLTHVGNITIISGGTLEGNILTLDEGATEVKYTYDAGLYDDYIYGLSTALLEVTLTVVEAPTHTAGDINGDGEINNKDLNRLMKYLLDGTTEAVTAALDVNGDGVVNNKDLNRLMKYLLDPSSVEIY